MHHWQSGKARPLTDRAPSFPSVLDKRWQFPRKWLNFSCPIVLHRRTYGDWSIAKRLTGLKQTWISWPNYIVVGGHPYITHAISRHMLPPVINWQSCNLCAKEGSKALTNFLSKPARRPLHNRWAFSSMDMGCSWAYMLWIQEVDCISNKWRGNPRRPKKHWH